MDMVCVEWRDAVFDMDTPQAVATMETYGLLWEKTLHYVTVAGEFCGGDGEGRAFTTIPASCIIAIHTLGIVNDA